VIPNADGEEIIEEELKSTVNDLNPHASTVFEQEPAYSKEEEEALLNFEVVSSNTEPVAEEPIVKQEEVADLELSTTPETPVEPTSLEFEINNPGADEIIAEPEFVKEVVPSESISLDDELKAS
jgi:hypothetical protein